MSGPMVTGLVTDSLMRALWTEVAWLRRAKIAHRSLRANNIVIDQAGLTGVGMSSGLAVSAVLLYRLATYWLPVAPGWVSMRLLQRRDYV